MRKTAITLLILLFAATATADPNDCTLHQINSTHWYFETTQTGLGYGTHNYQAFANNISSDYRTLTVAIPDPTTLANTTGNFWVNHTWAAGSGNVTDSYNVSVNQTWHNTTTDAFWNNTPLSPHGWSNITVYAWNNSACGTLSAGNISHDTQIPNNPVTITNTSDWSGNEGANVYVDYDATDADSDTPTFSCSRTDLFTDFNTAAGTGNWAPTINGTHYVDFGVSDGYGGTSNYTMTIQVGAAAADTIRETMDSNAASAFSLANILPLLIIVLVLFGMLLAVLTGTELNVESIVACLLMIILMAVLFIGLKIIALMPS